MNLTRLRLILRRYAPILAVVAIVLIGAISFGTIWFLQRAEGPVAPTAPVSQPSAAQNVCSVEWVIPNKCVGMKILNAAGAEVAPGADGKITVANREAALALRLRCEGMRGTNVVSFRILSNDNTWRTYEKIKTDKISENLPNPADKDCLRDPNSAACEKIPTQVRGPVVTSKLPIDFKNKTEFEVSCKPFAGDYGANKASIDASCRKTIVIAPTTTVGTCSDTCTNDDQCGGELICSTTTHMCVNPLCTNEADCSCSTSVDPLTCTTGAYNEQFADATLDTKLTRGGRGTMTVTDGAGVAQVLNTVATDRYVSLQSNSLISGNLGASVELKNFTSTPGTQTVLGRLELAGENGFPTYRIDWRKGAAGASQIVAHRVLASGGGALDTTAPVVIPVDSIVTLKAIREGTSLNMYYQLAGKSNVKVATFTASENLRPMLIVSSPNTAESTTLSADNFKLSCDTTTTNPPGVCKDSCGDGAVCGTGLSCVDGMCRNSQCTGESNCKCDDDEDPEEDLDSVLAVTELTCSQKNFTATITLDKDEDPDSGVTVRFTYNGQTITKTTDSNGEASATFTYVAGDKKLVVDPSDDYDEHSRTISFNQDCPGGTGTPTPTPVASCSKTCVTSSDCSNNLTCSNGMCRNPSCTNDADCTCNVTTPTPSTLPQAGGSSQLIAMVAIGVMVIGLGVTRFKFLKK